MDINVWHVNPIAVATIKIRVLPDLPAHLVLLVPMEKTVPMARKAKVDKPVVVKDTNDRQRLLGAFNVLQDPKETTVHPDPLEHLDPKANLVPKAETENPEAIVLAQPALLEHPDPMVSPVPEVITVPMPKLEAKALPVVKVKTAAPVQLAPKETMVPLVILARLVPPVLLVRLAARAIRLAKVNLVHLVNPAVPARMPNIVLAHIVSDVNRIITCSNHSRFNPRFLQLLQNYSII
jgi:hypothetical protein